MDNDIVATRLSSINEKSILVSSLDGVSLSTPVNEDFGDFVKAEANHDIYDSRWKEKEEKEKVVPSSEQKVIYECNAISYIVLL